MSKKIIYLPGDGSGPETGAAGLKVLNHIAQKAGLDLQVETHLIGGAAIDADGSPFPPSTQEAVKTADAVLLAAVGGPKWDQNPPHLRPEKGLLALRAALGVYANLRPIKPLPAAADRAPIKRHILGDTDMIFVRELIGGAYFGEKTRTETEATDVCLYRKSEIERVARTAGHLARQRRGKVTHVDKANVLETSRLWRQTVSEIFVAEFPDVTLEHTLVDAMAMRLITQPTAFDVILTENLFGDILTDEAAVLCGSLGCPPSASVGEGRIGLYEPIHGSAPDIAGKGLVNPIGMIGSIAMMLRHSLDRADLADQIEATLISVTNAGTLTRDLGGEATTEAFADAVIKALS